MWPMLATYSISSCLRLWGVLIIGVHHQSGSSFLAEYEIAIFASQEVYLEDVAHMTLTMGSHTSWCTQMNPAFLSVSSTWSNIPSSESDLLIIAKTEVLTHVQLLWSQSHKKKFTDWNNLPLLSWTNSKVRLKYKLKCIEDIRFFNYVERM
jgi:hypothetical protein